MQSLANPHTFSNILLCFTSVFIFLKYFRKSETNVRLLWAVFLLGLALMAVIDMLFFFGMNELAEVKKIVDAGQMSLGVVCLVAAAWCLVMKVPATPMLLGGALISGLFLFASLLWYHVEYVGVIINALCILLTLIISCMGLLYRRRSALWLIFAMMLLALATKAGVISIPMHPADINHYLMVLSVLCLGRASREQYKILF